MGKQALQSLIRCPPMEHGHRSWLAVDAAGLHDAIGALSTDLYFLYACHSLCIQEREESVKRLEMLEKKCSIGMRCFV